jgi:outer membrane protein assembly factor BamE
MHSSRPSRLTALAFAATVSAVATVGCASDDRSRSGFFQPYKIDVPQGNYIDQSMLGQVKPGMSRDQVRFALGTPLLVDPFHPDRWDYVFRFQHPNGTADLRRATVHFADGKVAHVESDALPAGDDGSDPALPGYRRKQGRNR